MLKINKDWLNEKEVGELKFTFETVNPQDENEKKTDIFNLNVVYDLPSGNQHPTPNAPVLSATKDTVTVNAVSGAEYRLSGGVWQDSNVFSGLNADTNYTVEMRIKSTVDYTASEIVSANIKTQKEGTSTAGCGSVGFDKNISVYILGIILLYLLLNRKYKSKNINN